MGTPLVENLKGDADFEVFVTTRSARPGGGNVHYVVGNAHDASFLYPLLDSRRWNAIVDFMVYTTDEFAGRMSKMLDSTDQYIFLSSSRVYADSGEEMLSESSPRLLDVCQDRDYLATDDYALAKAREENLLFGSGRKNYTVVRPYITFNDSRLQLGVYEKEVWLQRVLKGRSLVFSRDIGRAVTTLTYGADVSLGISGLLCNSRALGEVFHIATAQSFRWEEVLQVYLDVLEEKLGGRPEVKWTDTSLNLKLDRASFQVKYDRLLNRRFDNRKILSVVPGLRFTDSLQALRECLLHFLDRPVFLRSPGPGDWDSILMDKATGEAFSRGEFPSAKAYCRYWMARHAPQGLIEKYLRMKFKRSVRLSCGR